MQIRRLTPAGKIRQTVHLDPQVVTVIRDISARTYRTQSDLFEEAVLCFLSQSRWQRYVKAHGLRARVEEAAAVSP